MINTRRSDIEKGCWQLYCCPGCTKWFSPIAVAFIISFAIISFIFSVWALNKTNFSTSEALYTTSGFIANSPAAHALVSTSPTPLTMQLPNNLVEFIGGRYKIFCLTPGVMHKIKIQAGILPTTWDGVNTVATCNGVVPGTAIDFSVITTSVIQVWLSPGITFSP